MFIYVKTLYWSLTFQYVVAPKGAFFAVLLQWKLFSDVFQQLLECSVFSKVLEQGELIQVAGYVSVQGTTNTCHNGHWVLITLVVMGTGFQWHEKQDGGQKNIS